MYNCCSIPVCLHQVRPEAAAKACGSVTSSAVIDFLKGVFDRDGLVDEVHGHRQWGPVYFGGIQGISEIPSVTASRFIHASG